MNQATGKLAEELMAIAEQENSFYKLIPYRNLLTVWMGRHPADRMNIAKIGSHRAGNHLWCGGKEACAKVEEFIKKFEVNAFIKVSKTVATDAETKEIDADQQSRQPVQSDSQETGKV